MPAHNATANSQAAAAPCNPNVQVCHLRPLGRRNFERRVDDFRQQIVAPCDDRNVIVPLATGPRPSVVFTLEELRDCAMFQIRIVLASVVR